MQHEGRETFIVGHIPALKAVRTAAAITAIHALLEDLKDPGVFRDVNWQLVEYIAALEWNPRCYFVSELEEMTRRYRVEGKLDDHVAALVDDYVLNVKRGRAG